MVSAGYCHTVLLQSDGCAVACKNNSHGECNIPPLDEGVTYTQVSAGGHPTMLLRSDGRAVACGVLGYGVVRRLQRLRVPVMQPLIQVSAGSYHTVLLLNGGGAYCQVGSNMGQCNIPPLDDGVTYTQVSAGPGHTVLLRSE